MGICGLNYKDDISSSIVVIETFYEKNGLMLLAITAFGLQKMFLISC